MSWLRTSPLRQSFKRGRAPLDNAAIKCDPKACFDSFRKHWQQAYDVIHKSEVSFTINLIFAIHKNY